MKETLLDIKFSKNRFDKKKVILIKHLLQHSIPIKLREKIVNNLFDRAKSKIKQKALENFYITKKFTGNVSKWNAFWIPWALSFKI